MMNEQEQVELAAENDGYTNEWQRAAAWSAMQPKPADDRVKALGLVQDGLHVAVSLYPRHCGITDAVIGESVHIIAFGDSRDALLDAINRKYARGDFDSDERVEVWPLQRCSVPSVQPVEDTGIPF